MTNKELIEILHNIPQEIFQSKNHEKLHPVMHSGLPRIGLFTPNSYSVLDLTLYEDMQYRITYEPAYKNIVNQVESYLSILGFTEKPPNLYSSSRYTPELEVAINSIMPDDEIMKLMQFEISNQILNTFQDKE